MATIEEQIENIEQEIRKTPYHKGTEHHIGRLRAKLSNLKTKSSEQQASKSGGGGGYSVRKQGDATVVLVGPPSAGKSTLVNALTNAKSKIAPYAFTTVSVIPGMMKYNDGYVQILDVPGLIEGAEEGKGRGREVISVVRGADLLILISDVKRPEAIQRIIDTLERNGIRVDKQPPLVSIEKNLSGGLSIKTNLKQDLDKDTIKEVAREMGIKNAVISIRENLSMERLIDSFSKNRVYIPSLKVLNKADIDPGSKSGVTNTRHPALASPPNWRDAGSIYISAENNINLDKLREAIWEKLGLMRIF